MGDVYGPGMEVASDSSCTFPWLEFCHMDTLYCKGKIFYLGAQEEEESRMIHFD